MFIVRRDRYRCRTDMLSGWMTLTHTWDFTLGQVRAPRGEGPRISTHHIFNTLKWWRTVTHTDAIGWEWLRCFYRWQVMYSEAAVSTDLGSVWEPLMIFRCCRRHSCPRSGEHKITLLDTQHTERASSAHYSFMSSEIQWNIIIM